MMGPHNKPTGRRLLLAVCLAGLCLQGCSEPGNPASQPVAAVPPTSESQPPAAPESQAVPTPIQLSHEERKAPLDAVTTCNLERGAGAVFSHTPMDVGSVKGQVSFSGWVADESSRHVPPIVDIRLVAIDGSHAWRVPASTGLERNDIVSLLGGDTAFSRAGFSTEANLGELPPGTYRLYLVFDSAGALRVCDNGRAVVVQ